MGKAGRRNELDIANLRDDPGDLREPEAQLDQQCRPPCRRCGSGTRRRPRRRRRLRARAAAFDPDLEIEPPEPVLRFRAACEEAAGVLLAVPEYTFGLPGSFKNALDWTVRSGSLYRKPITVLNVAPPGRGAHAGEALDLVLRAHGADVARYSMPVARSDRNAAGEVDHPMIIGELRAVVAELAKRSSAAHESSADR
jgi:NAD(P)H-dependent FMN reductase